MVYGEGNPDVAAVSPAHLFIQNIPPARGAYFTRRSVSNIYSGRIVHCMNVLHVGQVSGTKKNPMPSRPRKSIPAWENKERLGGRLDVAELCNSVVSQIL